MIVFQIRPKQSSEETPSSFVSIKDNSFYVNDTSFFPVIMNYIIDLQSDADTNIWPSPTVSYYSYNQFDTIDKATALQSLRADFQMMRQSGINALRIVGAEPSINDQSQQLEIPTFSGVNERAYYSLFHKGVYDKYFTALRTLFDIAEEEGLKLIFLVTVKPEVYIRTYHLKELLSEFKDNSTIMAYDLFNEPLYFDSLERKKTEIYPITNYFGNVVKQYAPNHLSTIGLAGIREIFEWDPNLIDLDFLSFHPYEYEPNQVINEFYWYNQHVNKPWIVGETGIPADNQSVSYKEQEEFANITIEQAFNCGAMGYSWWQYREVSWGAYLQNHLGMVTLDSGDSITKKGLPLRGTVKPLANSFANFSSKKKKAPCKCADNYHDYTENDAFCISGVIVDEEGRPVPGATILAWNQWWSSSYTYITKADGSFHLTSDYPFYHWMASGPYHNRIKEDIDPASAMIKDGIPTLNLGTLVLSRID